MTLPKPIRLTRRGELLRAISHAVRCLSQVPASDMEAWRRDTHHFRESVYSNYADVIEHVPVEFGRWIDADAGIPTDQRAKVQLLERLSREIQRETRA